MTASDLSVETTDRKLIMTRTFDAPRDLVFAAFTSCEHLHNWWGPREWPMAECSMEFRVGGVWHYCLRGPNKEDEAWGRAVFEEIEEPVRIVYSDAFSDAEGNINGDLPQALSTYEFVAQSGRTKLIATTEYSAPADLQKVLDMGVIEGASATLERLAEHVEELVASEG